MFDESGVCGPCRYYESLEHVDWDRRRQDVERIAAWAKEHSRGGHHCIISVSGGKDSQRLALFARDELGLNPLLVSTVSPAEMQTESGTDNLSLISELGFDLITVSPAPKIWRTLMRKSLLEYGNYAKSTELCLYASAPRIAIAFGIRLICLGENNTLVYGESGAGEDGGDASNMVNYNTLGGGEIGWLLEPEGVEPRLIQPYRYPSKEKFIENGIRLIFLGYYIPEFNNEENGRQAVAHGLKGRDAQAEDIGSMYLFDAVDDDYVPVNQMLKYRKLGFGKATDEVCEAIRLGMMTREEGIRTVAQLDGMCHDRYVDALCRFLDIPRSEFDQIADSYWNERFFVRSEVSGDRVLKVPVGG